ncbi:ribosomal protein S21 [Cryptococcus depauperatus]|nr:ribosomal protein S21 [Cryptococcus depauperatus CBS 7855]
MSFLVRSTLRASSSHLPQALPRPIFSHRTVFALLPRYNSTQTTSTTVASLASQPAATQPATTSPEPSAIPSEILPPDEGMKRITNSLRIPESSFVASSSDPLSESWWIALTRKDSDSQYPSKFYSGRSLEVLRGSNAFLTTYKRLQGVMRNGNMKKEAKLNEFYEKPSVKRRRLRSERHRRRFKEMVRSKVQQAMAMRNRA